MGNKSKKTILYLGFNGFPYGFASGERQKLISKALIDGGNEVYIISKRGIHNKSKVNLPYKGEVEGIKYIYTSGSAYKSNRLIIKFIRRVMGDIGEFLFICSLRFKGPIDYGFLYIRDLQLLKYYKILSKIFNFRIVLDYTELGTAWHVREAFYKKFEDNSPDYLDKAICISDCLVDSVAKVRPSLPILKVPAICDLEEISKISLPDQIGEKYFLFCGTLFYLEVIEFAIESFIRSNRTSEYLYLVVNGTEAQHARFNALIEKNPQKAFIRTFSNLPYNQLISLYKNALALLIPLRPTAQDIARFPHKIGEYSSSGRPIITTQVGEIKNYFTDKKNAIIAESFDVSKYSEAMNFVLSNPEKADEIGKEGKVVAAMNFDYRAISESLCKFIS